MTLPQEYEAQMQIALYGSEQERCQLAGSNEILNDIQFALVKQNIKSVNVALLRNPKVTETVTTILLTPNWSSLPYSRINMEKENPFILETISRITSKQLQEAEDKSKQQSQPFLINLDYTEEFMELPNMQESLQLLLLKAFEHNFNELNNKVKELNRKFRPRNEQSNCDWFIGATNLYKNLLVCFAKNPSLSDNTKLKLIQLLEALKITSEGYDPLYSIIAETKRALLDNNPTPAMRYLLNLL